MADPIQTIKTVLDAAAPVTALVGNRISVRPRAQGDVLPAITLLLVSTAPTWNLQADSRLDSCRVQVDSWGASYAEAAALADAVRTALSAADRVLVSEVTDFDPSSETHVVSDDFLVWIDPV
jgi:hypothetical protein